MIFTPTIRGDQKVSEDIKKIQEVAQGKAQSVILFGSYGRGEGAIIDGKPRNDYDILLVNPVEDNHKGNKDVGTLIREAVPLAECHIVKDGDDVFPSQQWFEIKYASQLIAGEPLDLPLWEAHQIPYADAMRSLERRAVSLLVGKHEMMKENPDWRMVIEQICKGIIAIGDATLIRRGEFHPKYTMRTVMLEGDEIHPLYSMAVSLKIFGRPDMDHDQIWQLWQTTRDLFRKYCVAFRVTGEAIEYLLDYTDQIDKADLRKKLEIDFSVGRRWL